MAKLLDSPASVYEGAALLRIVGGPWQNPLPPGQHSSGPWQSPLSPLQLSCGLWKSPLPLGQLSSGKLLSSSMRAAIFRALADLSSSLSLSTSCWRDSIVGWVAKIS